jgi:Outer membrane protein beta-barrel domain
MQNFNKQRAIYTFILLTGFYTALAQNSPFKAGVAIGINFSQIDGDHQSGYDHKGYSFGLRGGFALNKRVDIMSELLYIEKGAQPADNINTDQRRIVIDLKYAEVPLLFTYHLKKNDRGFYNWSFHTGISYGRLLKSTAIVKQKYLVDTNITKTLLQENFAKQDWAYIIGLSYNIGSNFGIRFRSSYAINKLFINPNPEKSANGLVKREAYVFFRNYYVSFQGYYDFIAPKVKKPKKKIIISP